MLTKLYFALLQEQWSIAKEILAPSSNLVESPIYILMETQTLKIWKKKNQNLHFFFLITMPMLLDLVQ